MHITVDNDTNATQLYHLSVLFQSLAKEYGFKIPATSSTSVGELTVELSMDTSVATAAIDTLAAHAASKGVDVVELPPVTVSVVTPPSIESEGISLEELNTPRNGEVDLPPVTNDNLDSSGLPWDARIHAGSRERNTDGSWRVRRRPKGVEEAEWEATLARVTSELRDLMEIPVTPGAVADAAAETALTDDEIDTFVDIVQGFDTAEVGGDTTVETVIAPPVILPPVVLPPVMITPPAIATDAPAVTTFAQLMVWLTGHTPKDEAAKPPFVARVNEILAANQLTTLQQLGQRAELIPQVLAQFVEAFGE